LTYYQGRTLSQATSIFSFTKKGLSPRHAIVCNQKLFVSETLSFSIKINGVDVLKVPVLANCVAVSKLENESAARSYPSAPFKRYSLAPPSTWVSVNCIGRPCRGMHVSAALHAAKTEHDHGGGPGGTDAIATAAGAEIRTRSEAIDLIDVIPQPSRLDLT
jgi:hypothetical protein